MIGIASTKAGGLGLNLIGAQNLVIFDLLWNPTWEDQAMYRLWRSGQRRAVKVFRLVYRFTIEEKIFALQMEKTKRAISILNAGWLAQVVTRPNYSEYFKDTFPEQVALRQDTLSLIQYQYRDVEHMPPRWPTYPSREQNTCESLRINEYFRSVLYKLCTSPDFEAVHNVTNSAKVFKEQVQQEEILQHMYHPVADESVLFEQDALTGHLKFSYVR